jgi:hypothetical protein
VRLFADEEDERYGEFKSFHVRQHDGTIRSGEMTDRWAMMQKLTHELQAHPDQWVRAIFHGSRGERVEILRIGEDVPADAVDALRDRSTGNLYGYYIFEGGERQFYLTTKALWDDMEAKVAATRPVAEALAYRAIHGTDPAESHDGCADAGAVRVTLSQRPTPPAP